jgi:hypothetical protein
VVLVSGWVRAVGDMTSSLLTSVLLGTPSSGGLVTHCQHLTRSGNRQLAVVFRKGFAGAAYAHCIKQHVSDSLDVPKACPTWCNRMRSSFVQQRGTPQQLHGPSSSSTA